MEQKRCILKPGKLANTKDSLGHTARHTSPQISLKPKTKAKATISTVTLPQKTP
jgi:hypothetical protein